ncbi:helix-turn-helix transcriptional regulator [Ammoniphilus sp. CFH 90114]|uniref:helix-turn-helix transcriptional regulator n=1 Tax=Ammoniphilus sp. CFH 90114 TaxID=2493665 RepID=UPI00100FB531|nr:helix-turn-helix transcriptional regulator [Ammoniphilus sp. CFH 90114]RXT00988.1 XRE family transcriptional regulator [Ammoniphilus sp. CFH 90114]
MGTSMLKVILAERDISQKELAAVTGLSTKTISQICSGKQKPQIDNAYLISEALGLHVTKVFPQYSGLTKSYVMDRTTTRF